MGLEIIRKVYKKKAEEGERLRLKTIKDTFEAIQRLREEVPFQEAYLFGSVTETYQFGTSSDIDIAFKGLDRDRLFFAVSFLSRYLERDVNVVHIEGIDFKDKILKEGMRWKKE